jgi:hypothetical protein
MPSLSFTVPAGNSRSAPPLNAHVGGNVLRRIRTVAMSVIVTAALVGTPAAAHAGGVVDPAPIGPNQVFEGLVNDASANAIIQMGCGGPGGPGETGHPLMNQTVAVLPLVSPVSTDNGYTGSAANRINVTFGLPSTAQPAVVLTTWAVRVAIPTTLTLPCSGTGVVLFTPAPTSSTARPATVHVTFASQP